MSSNQREPMSHNKKQLILIATAIGLFTSLMLTGVAGNVSKGNYTAIPVILLALLLAVGVIWFGLWLNQKRIRLMFRDKTPDRLIANYHATLLHARARRIANADAAAAHLSALAATIYGQFDRAREELAAVDWDKAPAMYQGHRLHVLALIALLEKQDKAGALRLAAEAQALEQTEPAGSLPILHDAILIAAGEGGEELVTRTKLAADRKAGALPAICAWALWLHYYRAGQTTEANQYRERLRAAAPHFVAAPNLTGSKSV
jgi:hypothetical protein